MLIFIAHFHFRRKHALSSKFLGAPRTGLFGKSAEFWSMFRIYLSIYFLRARCLRVGYKGSSNIDHASLGIFELHFQLLHFLEFLVEVLTKYLILLSLLLVSLRCNWML